MSQTDERMVQARAELDELVAMSHNLPDTETVRLTAERIKTLVSIFDHLMADAIEHADQNRAMRSTIEIADRMLAKRDGIDMKGPIL